MSLQFQFPLWTFSTWYIFYFWNPYRESWFQGSPLTPHKILVVPRPIEFSNVICFFWNRWHALWFQGSPLTPYQTFKGPQTYSSYDIFGYLFLEYLEYILFLKIVIMTHDFTVVSWHQLRFFMVLRPNSRTIISK